VREGKAFQCECVLVKRVNARLPKRYQSASLLDFAPPVQQAVLDWFSKPGDGLLLYGAPGTGKTHLATALTRTLVLINFADTFFYRCSELYAAFREAYRTNASEETVLAEYVKHHFLILDDIGAGSLSDFERRQLMEVLDRRLNKCIPTIITSNWSVAQISERMDDRIASRLASFHLLEMQGRDRRMTAGA
jgi:DNA replication protein DnaC